MKPLHELDAIVEQLRCLKSDDPRIEALTLRAHELYEHIPRNELEQHWRDKLKLAFIPRGIKQ